MAENKKEKQMVQAFDYFKDRVYYKMIGHFLWTSHEVVKVDRLENWKEWKIECETMPDKVTVNGEQYLLVKEE